MRKLVLALVAPLIAAAALLFAGPAAAIVNGHPDGNRHPYVGLVIFYDANHVPLPGGRCTGTLVSSTVLLTAGHCAGLNPETGLTPASAQVWFDAGPIAPGNYTGGGAPCTGFTGYPCSGGDATGVPHAHPGWTGDGPFDIGVVVLDRPVRSRGFALLAPAGTLDLAAKLGPRTPPLGVVGYGIQSIPSPAGPPVDPHQRAAGTVPFLGLGFPPIGIPDTFVGYLNDPSQGAVTCFGDSGGPILLGANVLVGVISFTLAQDCVGPAFGYRTDTADSLGFLAQYGVRPLGGSSDDDHGSHGGGQGQNPHGGGQWERLFKSWTDTEHHND